MRKYYRPTKDAFCIAWLCLTYIYIYIYISIYVYIYIYIYIYIYMNVYISVCVCAHASGSFWHVWTQYLNLVRINKGDTFAIELLCLRLKLQSYLPWKSPVACLNASNTTMSLWKMFEIIPIPFITYSIGVRLGSTCICGIWPTPLQLETHWCVIKTVTTDALVLKHRALSIHNADLTFSRLHQIHTNISDFLKTT